jgi:hypothetical protein
VPGRSRSRVDAGDSYPGRGGSYPADKPVAFLAVCAPLSCLPTVDRQRGGRACRGRQRLRFGCNPGMTMAAVVSSSECKGRRCPGRLRRANASGKGCRWAMPGKGHRQNDGAWIAGARSSDERVFHCCVMVSTGAIHGLKDQHAGYLQWINFGGVRLEDPSEGVLGGC